MLTLYKEIRHLEFAGSLYFNPQNDQKDIGTVLVENVLINDAWISCGTSVEAGTLTLKNTTIDFRGSAYAPLDYGVISKNNIIKIAEGSYFTVLVDNALESLQTQVLDRVPAGTAVVLEAGIYYVEAEIVVPDGVTVDQSQAQFLWLQQ